MMNILVRSWAIFLRSRKSRETIADKIVTFVGDGASNTAQSWLFAAGELGFELRIASPKRYQPSAALLKRAGGRVICTDN